MANTHICGQELLDGVEKFICAKIASDTGSMVSLYEVSPGVYGWSRAASKYFDTRSNALAALATIDPDHGLV